MISISHLCFFAMFFSVFVVQQNMAVYLFEWAVLRARNAPKQSTYFFWALSLAYFAGLLPTFEVPLRNNGSTCTMQVLQHVCAFTCERSLTGAVCIMHYLSPFFVTCLPDNVEIAKKKKIH